MNPFRWIAFGTALVLIGGCGGETGDEAPLDEDIPCETGNCGKESFRRAIPGRSTVTIDFRRTSQRQVTPGHDRGRRDAQGNRRVALEAVAPAYDELGQHVEEINLVIEGLFAELEELAGLEPEIQDGTMHRWRRPDPDLPGNEEVLTIERSNEADFTLGYAAGPAGFEPTAADTLLTGEVRVTDDGFKSDFALTLDLDTATAIVPELGLTGRIDISAQPFPGGVREIWYDFAGVGPIGGELESSITTYWVFEEGSGALEYLDAFHDSDATIYARWDRAGGRRDYHVQWFDAEYGVLDEISTNCWGGGGAESFYGWALVDQALNFYVELDGDETACDFGALEGHPEPGPELQNLPADGEWDDLFASSVPFCEDDPYHPDCIYFCDLMPDACY